MQDTKHLSSSVCSNKYNSVYLRTEEFRNTYVGTQQHVGLHDTVYTSSERNCMRNRTYMYTRAVLTIYACF